MNEKAIKNRKENKIRPKPNNCPNKIPFNSLSWLPLKYI
jgi:hypothetical protein